MSSRIIIDGNAIYEVDEECLRKKKEKEQEEEHEKQQEKSWVLPSCLRVCAFPFSPVIGLNSTRECTRN